MVQIMKGGRNDLLFSLNWWICIADFLLLLVGKVNGAKGDSQVIYGDIPAGNFSYYTLSKAGSVKLQLHSLEGKQRDDQLSFGYHPPSLVTRMTKLRN